MSNSDRNPASCRQRHCHFTDGYVKAREVRGATVAPSVIAGVARSAPQSLCSATFRLHSRAVLGPRKILNFFEAVLKIGRLYIK